MNKSNKYRYIVLIAGIFLQFCCGIAYIWSVFLPYVVDKFHMDKGSASLPFGILLASFSLANVIGGLLQKKILPKVLVLIGGTIMSSGFILSSFLTNDQGEILNLTFGILAGFGCGLVYNTSVSTVQKWFPDKRGLVTGMLICSTGSFGLIMNPIAKSILSSDGFSAGIKSVGIILFIIIFLFGWALKRPEEEKGTSTQEIIEKQFSIGEVLKTKQYYLITFSMMLAVPAYLLINPMLMTLGVERGLSENAALYGVMIVAVMNTAGRLIAPWLSDKIGRKAVLGGLFILNMISILVLIGVSNVAFIVMVSLVGFSYGGFMGMYPTITSEYFGIVHNGVNYGAVMIGYGLSSIACPYLVKGVQSMEGGTIISFVIAATASILGFILIYLLEPVKEHIVEKRRAIYEQNT